MPDPNDLTPDNSQQGNQDNQDGQDTQNQDSQQQPNQQAQQQIDWENDGNTYKKRYMDSQGQIQPLVRTLNQFAEYDHNTKQWKPKTQAPQVQEDSNPEKVLEQYDPEFRKALIGLVAPLKTEVAELRRAREEQAKASEYNSKVEDSRKKAITEFGEEFDLVKEGKFNDASPLYKLADQILVEKYAQFNPDGSLFKYLTPEAEYLSIVEAYAIMAKRTKQQPQNKANLNAIQGKGTKSAGVKGKLSWEEYNKLSSEQKDTYDLQQVS